MTSLSLERASITLILRDFYVASIANSSVLSLVFNSYYCE